MLKSQYNVSRSYFIGQTKKILFVTFMVRTHVVALTCYYVTWLQTQILTWLLIYIGFKEWFNIPKCETYMRPVNVSHRIVGEHRTFNVIYTVSKNDVKMVTNNRSRKQQNWTNSCRIKTGHINFSAARYSSVIQTLS